MTILLVTTIHGTWAPNATWGEKTSPLLTAISVVTDLQLVTSNFVWSGNNNHEDRQIAAQALCDHCVRLRQEYGQARHVIIAHSHGGNVVQYGRRLTDLDRYADLFIFLGTPFLTFRKNHHVFKMFAAFKTSAYAVVSLSAALLFFFATAGLHVGVNATSLLVAASIFTLILCVTLYVRVNLKRQQESIRTAVRQSVRYLAAYQEPIHDPRIRVITHLLDEAYLYLRFLVLCNSMLELIYAAIHLVLRYRNGLVVLLVFVLTTEIVSKNAAAFAFTALGSLALAMIFYISIGMILAFAFLATAGGLRNNALGLGRETFMTGLIYSIRLQKRPVGLIQSSQRITVTMPARPLFHSVYYRDPVCTKKIAEWIKEYIDDKEVNDARM